MECFNQLILIIKKLIYILIFQFYKKIFYCYIFSYSIIKKIKKINDIKKNNIKSVRKIPGEKYSLVNILNYIKKIFRKW